MPNKSTNEPDPMPGGSEGLVPTNDSSPLPDQPRAEALEEFLHEHNFTKEQLRECGLDWPLLCQIRDHHVGRVDELKSTGNLVVQRLQGVAGVHSLKVRVKDPGHLVAKIVRMRIEQPDLQITPDSYEEHVKDLIGVRALHLFKDEWPAIHKFVAETWEPAEDPVAYVREGDEMEVDQFKAAGCRVEVHPYGYRSIHYRFTSQPFKRSLRIELQVRTIFEEAWSEIDHKLRYPRQSSDPTLTSFLVIFNRLAGFGDEMGMYAKHLSSTLRAKSEQLAEAESRQQAQEQELRKMLSEVQMGKKGRDELQKKLDALEKSSQNARQIRVSVGDLDLNPSIFGFSANLRIGSPTSVTVPSALSLSPSGPSVIVNSSGAVLHLPNPLSVGVQSPSPPIHVPDSRSVGIKDPGPVTDLIQPPPLTETVLSRKPVLSKAARRRFQRKKQRERPTEKKP
jgi:putative GTP pyrophosphokinase